MKDKALIMLLFLMTSWLYSQDYITKDNMIKYIETDLYEELMNTDLFSELLDLFTLMIGTVQDDVDSYLELDTKVNNIIENKAFSSVISASFKDADIRKALKSTLKKVIKDKMFKKGHEKTD